MNKVLVIGDGCTDIFQYGKCNRLSPEAPIPIFNPTYVTTNSGMAINVADNIKALGVDCDIITNDMRPAKTRYIDEVSNQILLRVDVNDEIPEIEEKIIDDITFENYDAVVISDYNKGYLTEEDIEYIGKRHPLVFMDTKKKLDTFSEPINFLKLNEKEYGENYHWLRGVDYDYSTLIMTKGKDGAILDRAKIFPIENAHPVRDLSGAGDTFLAGLVVEYLKNKNIEDAINFANKCSAWVVTQKGVVTVDPKLI